MKKVSGFSLKKMSLKLVANSRQTSIDNFAIELPETSLKLDTIHLIYDSLKAFDRFYGTGSFFFPYVAVTNHFKRYFSFSSGAIALPKSRYRWIWK